MPGSQDFAADPRNEKVLIYLNGALVPRAEARVSVFDAGFVLGDGVWEGLRLHKGGLLFLGAHLDRLYDGARAIALDIGLSREEMVAALRRTVEANAMESGVHIRAAGTTEIPVRSAVSCAQTPCVYSSSQNSTAVFPVCEQSQITMLVCTFVGSIFNCGIFASPSARNRALS